MPGALRSGIGWKIMLILHPIRSLKRTINHFPKHLVNFSESLVELLSPRLPLLQTDALAVPLDNTVLYLKAPLVEEPYLPHGVAAIFMSQACNCFQVAHLQIFDFLK